MAKKFDCYNLSIKFWSIFSLCLFQNVCFVLIFKFSCKISSTQSVVTQMGVANERTRFSNTTLNSIYSNGRNCTLFSCLKFYSKQENIQTKPSVPSQLAVSITQNNQPDWVIVSQTDCSAVFVSLEQLYSI